MHISELPTPVLLLDLDKAERNLHKMAGFFSAAPAKLRPHFKNHKCIELARRQLQAGANGITCATLREAEHLVNAGFKSILVANEISSTQSIDRFLALSAVTDVMVAIDNLEVAARLGDRARAQAVRASVLVDVDLGLRRCGVAPGGSAVDLALAVVSNGLQLRGLMGYEGHLVRRQPGADKSDCLHSAMQSLFDTKLAIENAGLPIGIVSVGGTGSYEISGQFPGVTELQAGSYLLMETDYATVCPEFEIAITVLATVVSKTAGDRVVLDAGVKSISCERGLPTVKDAPGLTTERVNAEHSILRLEQGSEGPAVGQNMELWVRYGDGTVNLHDRYYGVRGETVVEVLPICR